MTQDTAPNAQDDTQMLADAEALAVSLKEKQAEIEGLHARLNNAVASAEAKLAEIDAILADTKSVQTSTKEIAAGITGFQTAAGKHAADAEALLQSIQNANTKVVAALEAINTQKTAAEESATAAEEFSDGAKEAAQICKNLASTAEAVDTRVASYESKLTEIIKKSEAQLTTITGLLPGATSAGLAHAFDERRQTFLKPGNQWQGLFIGSVVAIVVLAGWVLWSSYQLDKLLSWDEISRLWIVRLPVVGALVWLAIHSSRESALAKRLEEDYGYKAAIAASFQGFQKQMAEIGASAEDNPPLNKLCGDTLMTIASPPGRIYEKHSLTVTPAGELATAARSVLSSSGNDA